MTEHHLGAWDSEILPGQDVLAAQGFTDGLSLRLGRADQKGDVFSSLSSELFNVRVQLGPEFSEYGVDLSSVRRRDSLRTQCPDAVVTTGFHAP